MFIEVDKSWKTIMRRVQKNPTAIRAATQTGEWAGFSYMLWVVQVGGELCLGGRGAMFRYILWVGQVGGAIYLVIDVLLID